MPSDLIPKPVVTIANTATNGIQLSDRRSHILQASLTSLQDPNNQTISSGSFQFSIEPSGDQYSGHLNGLGDLDRQSIHSTLSIYSVEYYFTFLLNSSLKCELLIS